jgi:hypothetical protein
MARCASGAKAKRAGNTNPLLKILFIMDILALSLILREKHCNAE